MSRGPVVRHIQFKTGTAKRPSKVSLARVLAEALGDLIAALAEVEGQNLLTLSDHVVNKDFINRRLAGDFEIHGHLVRTLIADLLRRARPDALWALQEMLGHTDRHTQQVYRSEFDEGKAVQEVDALLGRLSGSPSRG